MSRSGEAWLRLIALGACLTALAVGCRSSSSSFVIDREAVRLEGLVSAGDGAPLPLAHVHLFRGRTKERTVEVGLDGSFSVDVPTEAPITLVFTAVDHERASVEAAFEAIDPDAVLTVTLARHAYRAAFDNVRVIGDWNEFDWDAAEAMARAPDGTFVWEGPVAGGEIAYQLLNVVDGRSINGTSSDRFAYDGAGDYRSLLAVAGGRARIVFDPAAISRASEDDRATVVWGDRHEALNRLQRVTGESARVAEVAPGGDDTVSADELLERRFAVLEELMSLMNGSVPSGVRRLAALRMASLPGDSVDR